MPVCILVGGAAGGASSDEVTAAKGDVLAGKTAVTSDSGDEPAEGTMPDNGAVSQTLAAGASYTIPQGYHNGSGKVTATALASQTAGDAAAGDVLSGKTAWVNGAKVTGSMANRGNVSQTLAAGASYTIPQGYHGGSGKVTANAVGKMSVFTLDSVTTNLAHNAGSTSTFDFSIKAKISSYASLTASNIGVGFDSFSWGATQLSDKAYATVSASGSISVSKYTPSTGVVTVTVSLKNTGDIRSDYPDKNGWRLTFTPKFYISA